MAKIQQLPNHIDEYFTSEANKITKHAELFRANDDNIDVMTELSHDEIRTCLALIHTDKFLSAKKISNIYAGYVTTFMRLQVSKERKSRGEYVDVHKNESLEVVGEGSHKGRL